MSRTPQRAAAGTAQYLLFVGWAGTRGRVAGRFSDADEARRAFIHERLARTTPDAWARLEAVDGSGRADVVCWFGDPANRADGKRRPTCLPSLPRPPRRRRSPAKAAFAAVAAVMLLAGCLLAVRGWSIVA